MADGVVLEFEVILENGEFKVKSKQVKDDIDKTGDAVEKAGKKGKKGFGRLNAGIEKFRKSAKAFVALTIVVGIFKLAKASLQSAAAFEKQRIALTTMLKSGEKADKLLKKITAFAGSTPFQLPGLIDASKRLLAFGVDAESIIPTLRNLGNAAGGNAEVLDRLTLAYGKLRAKGKASLDEINAFTEAGVPLLDALANKFGVTTQEVGKMISTGKVGFADVKTAIEDLTTGTGKFAGLLEKQSQSLSGLFSTLKDKIGLLALDMGKKLSPAMKDLTAALLDGTESGGVFSKILTNVAWILTKITNSITVFVRGMNLLTTTVERGLIKVQKLRFRIAKGVSEERILQNRGRKDYAEYIELVEREAKLKNEGQGRLNKFISSTEELLGLTEKIKKTEEEAAVISKKIQQRKAASGTATGKGGKSTKSLESFLTKAQREELKDFEKAKGVKATTDNFVDFLGISPELFQERTNLLKDFYAVDLTLAEQKAAADAERSNRAATEYEQFLNTKLGLDSVYYQGLQTVANTASVFLAQENKKLFRFGQALAISQSWINTFQGMTKAYAQLGPIGGPIGAGVVFAAGVLQTKQIAQRKPPEYAVGSFSVPSTSPAIVHQGEMIIPKTFAESIRSGEASVGGGGGSMPDINVQIEGETVFRINERFRDEAAQNQGSPGSFPQESAY